MSAKSRFIHVPSKASKNHVTSAIKPARPILLKPLFHLFNTCMCPVHLSECIAVDGGSVNGVLSNQAKITRANGDHLKDDLRVPSSFQ